MLAIRSANRQGCVVDVLIATGGRSYRGAWFLQERAMLAIRSANRQGCAVDVLIAAGGRSCRGAWFL